MRGVEKIAARRRVEIKHLEGLKKRKFYQISEALALFDRGIKELSVYYPIPRKAIKEFEEAVRRGKIVIMVTPGEYLEKHGSTVTAGRMIYSPSRDAWVIQLPKSAFDVNGNLKPTSLLTLWHELTHVVRSFVPELEKLPTAYDEATTNFIADRLAMLFASRGVKGKHLVVDPRSLEMARRSWRKTLVYKPELVEKVFSKLRGDRIAEEHRKKIFEEFARGEMLKRKVRALVSNENEYLDFLKKTNPRLYKIHLVNLARRKLESNKKSLESWMKKLPYGSLVDALAMVGENHAQIAGYLSRIKTGDQNFRTSLRNPKLREKVRRVISRL